ncbi:hypothetical protein OUZ56_031182 [Daphnia magna]|uniref:Reverse transcriptase domain-containing protein n=1 Tax=Daphnia magna TaxID=35525 RepID=A0ABQ9ZTI3_9CRUS|nr:hypothetical protein OUZ56_031182 [Daphnia magna]
MDLKSILMEFWYKKVRVRWKGTEEFRILCYRKCYGNPFGFDSAVGAALFCKALLQSDDSSRVHDIHIDNGFLRKDESEQVVTSLQQLGLNLRSYFPDSGFSFLLSYQRSDLMFRIVVIWDNLLLGQVSLRPDLIGAASHMASSRTDAI